jgi:K+-transporting ATPase ATPase A chain
MHWLHFIALLVVVVATVRPLGLYLARVFERGPTFLDRFLCPVESLLCRVVGVDRDHEMSARDYICAFIAFGIVSTAGLFVLLIAQRWLPGGPDDRYLSTPMTLDLAVNTAVSFSTTTTWQAYSGESTLRYIVQGLGLVSQNFLAGAAGLAVGFAFIRGFARERSATLGNFWVDLIRAVLWVLLPLALVGSFALVWLGVPVNLARYTEARTLEGGVQIIAQGPVAALEFIKNLGTNGGGFFNVNGAHPYENPTPSADFLALVAIALLPASLPIAFGHLSGRPRAGWTLLWVMIVLVVGGVAVCDVAETATPPRLAELHVGGGNMEGKEVRFGIDGSVMAAVVTSNGATGSYNSMHDSYRAMGVLVPLVNMLLGEVAFGGLGTGLTGLVMVALVAVFLGGLMIGRTPEYLGKKITAGETRLIVLYALLTPALVLVMTAAAVATPQGRAGLVTNSGTRGFTEILFAYASCMANNGQTMAGLNANSVFYNATTAITMVAGRFGLSALALAVAGQFAAQRRGPSTPGTMPSDSLTFAVLVLGTIVLVGALCFLPALSLGPIAEALEH